MSGCRLQANGEAMLGCPRYISTDAATKSKATKYTTQFVPTFYINFNLKIP